MGAACPTIGSFAHLACAASTLAPAVQLLSAIDLALQRSEVVRGKLALYAEQFETMQLRGTVAKPGPARSRGGSASAGTATQHQQHQHHAQLGPPAQQPRKCSANTGTPFSTAVRAAAAAAVVSEPRRDSEGGEEGEQGLCRGHSGQEPSIPLPSLVTSGIGGTQGGWVGRVVC
jgi:hypothetical protein